MAKDHKEECLIIIKMDKQITIPTNKTSKVKLKLRQRIRTTISFPKTIELEEIKLNRTSIKRGVINKYRTIKKESLMERKAK